MINFSPGPLSLGWKRKKRET